VDLIPVVDDAERPDQIILLHRNYIRKFLGVYNIELRHVLQSHCLETLLAELHTLERDERRMYIDSGIRMVLMGNVIRRIDGFFFFFKN